MKIESTMLYNTARRRFLGTSGMALSAATIGLLAGREVLAAAHAASAQPSGDVAILNVALGLEHQGIAAYQIGAESGLLKKPLLDVAVLFQGHHKAHRDLLAGAIGKLGGRPVEALSMDAYRKSSALNVASIATDMDVLRLAQRLELGATNAYLGVIPAFADHELAKVAGRLAADETMHYTALTQALGQPLPVPAMYFGA